MGLKSYLMSGEKNLVKDRNLQIQEAELTPNRIHPKNYLAKIHHNQNSEN